MSSRARRARRADPTSTDEEQADASDDLDLVDDEELVDEAEAPVETVAPCLTPDLTSV